MAGAVLAALLWPTAMFFTQQAAAAVGEVDGASATQAAAIDLEPPCLGDPLGTGEIELPGQECETTTTTTTTTTPTTTTTTSPGDDDDDDDDDGGGGTGTTTTTSPPPDGDDDDASGGDDGAEGDDSQTSDDPGDGAEATEPDDTGGDPATRSGPESASELPGDDPSGEPDSAGEVSGEELARKADVTAASSRSAEAADAKSVSTAGDAGGTTTAWWLLALPVALGAGLVPMLLAVRRRTREQPSTGA